MADNALKIPFSQSIGDFADGRANGFAQVQAKGLPCTVTKIDKDIVTVSFQGSNGVWTMPQMKMTQAISPYGRDPTQVGDKGYAAPSDYSLQSQTDLGGGTQNFGLRGNLTPLCFHPVGRVNSESRDYNQLTHAGGPTGVKIIQQAKQPSSNQQPPGTPTPQMVKRLLGMGTRARRAWANRPALLDDSTQQQQDNRSYYEVDKNGRHALRSMTGKVSSTVDENANKITLRAPASGGNVWVGGNGVDNSLYGPMLVATPMGLMVTCNSKGKWQRADEKDELGPAIPPASGDGSGDGSGGNADLRAAD